MTFFSGTDRCKHRCNCNQRTRSSVSQPSGTPQRPGWPELGFNSSQNIFPNYTNYSRNTSPPRPFHSAHDPWELDQHPVRIPNNQNYSFANQNSGVNCSSGTQNFYQRPCSFHSPPNPETQKFVSHCHENTHKCENVTISKPFDPKCCAAAKNGHLSHTYNRSCSSTMNLCETHKSMLNTSLSFAYCTNKPQHLSHKSIQVCQTTTNSCQTHIISECTNKPVQEENGNCKACGSHLEKTACGMAMSFDLNICPKCVPKSCNCSNLYQPKDLEESKITTETKIENSVTKNIENHKPQTKTIGVSDDSISINSIATKISNATAETQASVADIEGFTNVAKPEVYIPTKRSIDSEDNDYPKLTEEKASQLSLNMFKPWLVKHREGGAAFSSDKHQR